MRGELSYEFGASCLRVSLMWGDLSWGLTGSAVITHDVTTGTGYCLVGFNWIIDFLN